MTDDNKEKSDQKKKLTFREFFSLGEVGAYFFRKKSNDQPRNINLKLMHGINKLALFIFLISVVYFLLKKFVF